MYSKSSPLRGFLAIIIFAGIFTLGFYLLRQVQGLDDLNKSLSPCAQPHPYSDLNGYDLESLNSVRQQISGALPDKKGLDIFKLSLKWDYLFILSYLFFGYIAANLTKQANARITQRYRANIRVFLVLMGLADILENTALLILFSISTAEPTPFLVSLAGIAGSATIVKFISFSFLFLVLIVGFALACRKFSAPTITKPQSGSNEKKAKKPKNIILFSDGTGNSSAKDRGTNVFKLFEALDLGEPSANKVRQIAFYDDGVGTEGNKILRGLGGAFGVGLSRNVKELYTELARNYEPGDRIYLFGFSRGAFTVRTLSGMIANCGILHPNDDLEDLVEDLYYFYRRRYPTKLKLWKDRLKKRFSGEKQKDDSLAEWKDKYTRSQQAKVTFLGVWDTVDAYGLPWDPISKAIDTTLYKFTFPDHDLNEQVEQARHAIAIDDERKTFHPVLWDEKENEGKEESQRRIKQVWFPGVHSNVGGGYPRQGLSLISLNWMIKEATANGLRMLPKKIDEYKAQANPYAHLYDSRSGAGLYYYYKPRKIAKLCEERHMEVKLHKSVMQRIAYSPEDYSPGNLPSKFEVVDSGTSPIHKEDNLKVPSPVRVHRRQAMQWAFWSATVVTAVLVWIFSENLGSSIETYSLAASVIVAFLALTKTFGILPFLSEIVNWQRDKQKEHYSKVWRQHRENFKKLIGAPIAPRRKTTSRPLVVLKKLRFR
ncbi:MAG: DUF2235 domain-containing protein [Verrucomicrobiota bacterium]